MAAPSPRSPLPEYPGATSRARQRTRGSTSRPRRGHSRSRLPSWPARHWQVCAGRGVRRGGPEREAGRCCAIDCGSVEPTERGLLASSGGCWAATRSIDAIAAALAACAPPVLFVFDGYEAFRLLDGWMRQNFHPVHARPRPGPARELSASLLWLDGGGGLARSVSADAARPAHGQRRSCSPSSMCPGRIGRHRPLRRRAPARPHARVPRGTAAARRARRYRTGGGGHPILARRYLAGIADPMMRQCCGPPRSPAHQPRAAAGARSGGGSGRALRPRGAAVRGPRATGWRCTRRCATHLPPICAAEPEMHLQSRQLAWRHASHEARIAAPGELWRCTANLIYFIRNPAVRDAFFPPDTVRLAVEPARPDDLAPILHITADHDGHAAELLHGALVERGPGRILRRARARRTRRRLLLPAGLGHRDPREWRHLPRPGDGAICSAPAGAPDATANRRRCCSVAGSPGKGASGRHLCRRRAGWTSSATIWSGGRGCGAFILRWKIPHPTPRPPPRSASARFPPPCRSATGR